MHVHIHTATHTYCTYIHTYIHTYIQTYIRYLSKKRLRNTCEHFAKAREEHVLVKRSRYSRTNVREVHEMHTTTVAVRMRIGIYTVRKLRDNTVAMGLRFCLHEVVVKNRDQFATFFLTSTVHTYIHTHTHTHHACLRKIPKLLLMQTKRFSILINQTLSCLNK